MIIVGRINHQRNHHHYYHHHHSRNDDNSKNSYWSFQNQSFPLPSSNSFRQNHPFEVWLGVENLARSRCGWMSDSEGMPSSGTVQLGTLMVPLNISTISKVNHEPDRFAFRSNLTPSLHHTVQSRVNNRQYLFQIGYGSV